MFGKFGQQVTVILATLLVSTACLAAAVGPATATGQMASVAARSFA